MIKKILASLFGVLIILFILASNFTLLNLYFPEDPYIYCADNGTFTEKERIKGRDPLRGVEIYFDEYKKVHNKPDLILYRQFRLKWWWFWNWNNYLTQRRWTYPYRENCNE